MANPRLEQAALWFLRCAPRQTFSTLVGFGAGLSLPPPFLSTLMKAFSQIFGANQTEAEKPLHEYRDINEFFTRKLRPECRPVHPGDTLAIAPVDATLVQLGRASNERLIQAKGISYSISRLLGSESLGQKFANGAYATLYLKPGYYHRIHSPLAGTITDVLWIPGDRYPVTPMTVRRLPGLYHVNERKIVVLETVLGCVAVVMVAALGVSNITLSLPSTNGRPQRPTAGNVYRLDIPHGLHVAKGDELGVFHLGSTVIVLFQPEKVDLAPIAPGTRLFMGEPLAFEAGTENRNETDDS